MSTGTEYGAYLTTRHRREQHHYRARMRESDRVLVELTESEAQAGRGTVSVLDVGCASGNLAYHLHRSSCVEHVRAVDVYPEVIEQNRRDPELSGIDFKTLDLITQSTEPAHDVVIVNAVLMFFDEPALVTAVANLIASCRSGGAVIGYDFFQPYPQQVVVKETTRDHAEGLTFRFRSFDAVGSVFHDRGYDIEFMPFDIPIDLDAGGDPFSLFSYTRRLADGRRLIFRGALHTPWCHFVARPANP